MKNTINLINSAWVVLLTFGAVGIISDKSYAQNFDDFFSNNGSFEVGSTAPPLDFPSANSSVDTVTGWRLMALGSYPLWLEDANAQDGNRYIRLRSTGGAVQSASGATINGNLISHTPFSVGELYELSFWAAGGAAANNFIRVSLSGTALEEFLIPTYTQTEFDALPGLEWQKYVVPFVATNSTFTLTIASPDSSQGGYQSLVYLDNFAITQVPEPGSALLVVMGGGLIFGVRRKRALSTRIE